jgi:hypothetical protein
MSRGQRILKSEVGMRKWEKGKEHSAEGRKWKSEVGMRKLEGKKRISNVEQEMSNIEVMYSVYFKKD